MNNQDVFTFHLRKSIARGALYLIIFISMVDHAVTLIYDPDGRLERLYRKENARSVELKREQNRAIAEAGISCLREGGRRK